MAAWKSIVSLAYLALVIGIAMCMFRDVPRLAREKRERKRQAIACVNSEEVQKNMEYRPSL